MDTINGKKEAVDTRENEAGGYTCETYQIVNGF